MRASKLIHQTRRVDKFYLGLVHEVTGPAQSGKSYLCYHEVISYLHAQPGCAVIVDTNGSFQPQLMARLIQQRGGNEDMLDRIQISRCLDIYGVAEAVQEVASGFVPGMPAANRVGILLIDNITNPLALLMQRGGSGGHDLMVCVMRELTLLSRMHSVAVLVVNTTVSTAGGKRPPRGPETGGPEGLSGSSSPGPAPTNRDVAFCDVAIKPALGTTWPHLVDYTVTLYPVPDGTPRVPGKRGFIEEVTRSRVGGLGTWQMV